jgi:hypothetical protein
MDWAGLDWRAGGRVGGRTYWHRPQKCHIWRPSSAAHRERVLPLFSLILLKAQNFKHPFYGTVHWSPGSCSDMFKALMCMWGRKKVTELGLEP